MISRAVFLSSLAVIFHLGYSYVESVAANVNGPKNEKSGDTLNTEFHPMVAFKCGYRNRYLDTHGNWVTDKERYAVCLKGKLDILKYCRKSYPELEVTNIVEDTHFHKIGDWCKEEGTPCKWTHTVRPFRCIVGEFQSEALLVPQGCRFGHVDDRQVCETFPHWEETAKSECGKREGGMTTKSFALLAPCGLDMYSGVEFVCCPKEETNKEEVKTADLGLKAKVEEQKKDDEFADEDDDDDSEEDEYYDDDDEDDDEDESSSAEDKDQDESTTEDPYFRVADPDNEHELYKEALKRLDERHRQKVAKVMREWSELEARYQTMKTKDPRHAEEFKKQMTERFQKTVAALEDENEEEKKQLDEVHQERVQATLNERKRQTIKAYRDSLALNMDSSQPHRVLKTLQAYIRSEEKDRTHALNRYKHLLRTDPEAAEKFRSDLLRRLHDIDLRVNGTVAMLHDLPKLEDKIKVPILEFWKTFRKENTPQVKDESVIGIAKGLNTRLVDEMKKLYQQQPQHEEAHLIQDPIQVKIEDDSEEETEDEEEGRENERILDQYEARPVYNRERERAFHQAHVTKEAVSSGGGHTLLILGIAGAALLVTLVLGVLLVRRRPHYDLVPRELPISPEEKMVAAMQVNGYENPTYHFFEKA